MSSTGQLPSSRMPKLLDYDISSFSIFSSRR